MDARLRSAARERAQDACEYCLRKQETSLLVALQIEHIIPRKHGGDDDLENLALACADCNLRKSSDLAGIDPATGALTPLFNPRQNLWSDHFEWDDVRIVGRTAIGRVTVRVLSLNLPARLRIRRRWRKLGL